MNEFCGLPVHSKSPADRLKKNLDETKEGKLPLRLREISDPG
jgi:hypothetical protein